MTRPYYASTSRGQVRLYVGGTGRTLVVLAGLTRAASCVADELAALLPRRRVVVVETPGVGGSARADASGLAERVETVVAALGFLGRTEVDLVALEHAVALVPGVASGLAAAGTPCGVTVLVDERAPLAWADHGTTPPSPAARVDGTHLTAFWSFLRDRRLVRPDDPTQPRTHGAPLPGVRELHAGFVAATTRPEAYVRAWDELTRALTGGGVATAGATCVDTLAELASALPATGESDDGSSLAVPVTTPAPGTGLWHDYVQTSVGLAHLRRAGSTGRPLLVLSTGGGSSAQFEPVVRGLAEGRTVAALDYFGNGLSEPLDRTPDVGDLAAEAFAVADALGWDSFDVWGSHTGACTALEMTVTRPERIGRAVLEAPVVISADFRDDLQAHYFPDLAADPFGTHVQRAWHWRREVFLYWPWYRVDHAAARSIGLPSAEDLQLYAVGIHESGATYDGAYRAAFDYDTRARLPLLTRPAILVAGPHDMLANALDDAADLVPDDLLRIVDTPATVWWPDPEPQAAADTMTIYREFLR
ncbi:alpha/beta hydrolase [Nocardioides plantarum]|uniref:Alpha/beta hydrolase n=1 Tax=Nocardioides plantarum TaxID=29299 RepID=A0ABV5KJI4_9ACTN|nr:alpha/beta hydrolase [Nocardioides plantarum]